MDEDAKDKIPPGATFYIRMCNYYDDNCMSLDGESLIGGTNVDDALEPLKRDVQEHGLFGYVYECIPIIKVIRPNLKIIDLRKKRKKTGTT